MTSEHLPDWLPASVSSMAAVSPIGGEVKRRLLTDQRMKGVWRTLLQQNASSAALNETRGFDRLRDWDIDEYSFTTQEVACAAVFAFAANELSSVRHVLKRPDLDAFAEKLRDAAQMCEMVKGYRPPNREIEKALADARSHMDQIASEIEQRVRSGDPYIIGRERGREEQRVRARALATETIRLYGTALCGTVGTIVSVAMEVTPTIDDATVRKWCADLLPQ